MSRIHQRLEALDARSMPSSPLHRRSGVSRMAEPADAAENNEAERLRLSLKKKQLQDAEAENRYVSKMSNSQIANGMTMCITLATENKINVKNAFSLDMIEFMTRKIKQRDGKTSNLHEASIWLDVSAKIYGFRVDSVHTDALKMIGGLNEQEKRADEWDSGLGAENSEPGSDNDFECERSRRAKRKKSKRKILASAESLRAPLDLISPASMTIDKPDSQTTKMLFQAVLPVHANSDLYLHAYEDVILDTVNPEMEAVVNNAPVDIPRLERFEHLELCRSFANFEFLGWSAEEEDLTPEASSQPLVENDDFQFDLEASLPADDEPGPSGMNYFETEDDDNENIEVHDNTNMQSFLQRFSAENIYGSRIVEDCTQESIKRSVVAMIFDKESSEAAMEKFESVQKEVLQLDRKRMKVAWSEVKLTLPPHVDYLQYCRYFLRPEVVEKLSQNDQMNGTFLPFELVYCDYNNENETTDCCPDIETEDYQAGEKVNVGDYDCNNNENDTMDYRCNIETEDHQVGIEENCNNGADLEKDVAVATQGFTGDNLVEAPKMPNRIFIPFPKCAKKIDMRDLKRAVWEELNSAEGDEENVDVVENSGGSADKVNGSKKFSELVGSLPNRLTKSNAEALSVPIAFMSLLQVANEQNLQIDSADDRIDLHIRQG